MCVAWYREEDLGHGAMQRGISTKAGLLWCAYCVDKVIVFFTVLILLLQGFNLYMGFSLYMFVNLMNYLEAIRISM